MDVMHVNVDSARDQVVDRRRKLESAIAALGPRPDLTALLFEVDAALERLAVGTYGLCDTCHEPVEADRLMADPLLRFCLDHLSPAEQRALEQDLQLAARVQQGMLPDVSRVNGTWQVAYSYRPARIVSGDYCDLVSIDGDLYFMLGDVSGKGVAAATVMAQLHAMFRALLPVNLHLGELVARASRLLCESTLPTHYATLVCGRARPDGELEVCNAGHVPPLVARSDGVTPLPPGGMPMGMFAAQQFDVQHVRLAPGEMLVLCTDGLTETEQGDGEPFGLDRLGLIVQRHTASAPPAIVDACLHRVDTFRGARQAQDDVTLMVVRRP